MTSQDTEPLPLLTPQAGLAPAVEGAPRVAPARVLEVAGSRLLVEAADCRCWARIAIPVVYTPVVGDEVLVLAQDGHGYVIGVLQGAGPVSLRAPGDLNLEAGGTVQVRGRTLRLEGEEVEVHAGRMRQWADTVKQRFGKLMRRVKGSTEVRSGSLHCDVEGIHRTRAERIVGNARKEVRLDGDQIQLG